MKIRRKKEEIAAATTTKLCEENNKEKTYLRTIYETVLCIYVGEVLMVMHTKLLYQRNINMQLYRNKLNFFMQYSIAQYCFLSLHLSLRLRDAQYVSQYVCVFLNIVYSSDLLNEKNSQKKEKKRNQSMQKSAKIISFVAPTDER